MLSVIVGSPSIILKFGLYSKKASIKVFAVVMIISISVCVSPSPFTSHELNTSLTPKFILIISGTSIELSTKYA